MDTVGARLRVEHHWNCYNPGSCVTGESVTSRTVLEPLAGVWEVSVDARRTSDADNAPFTLTATILGVTVEPNPDVIETATVGSLDRASSTPRRTSTPPYRWGR